MTNCRNCGAVLTGHICEYCGTTYPVETNGTVYYANNAPYIIDPEPLPTYPLDTEVITWSANLYNAGLVSPNELRKFIDIKKRLKKNDK